MLRKPFAGSRATSKQPRAAAPFASSFGVLKAWLRRGPVTGTKNAVGASLNPAYKLDEGYCHAYPTTWSGQFLAAFVLAAAMYSVGGALYGQRVLRRDGPLLQAHPHAARWL